MSDDTYPLASLSLTHVHYVRDCPSVLSNDGIAHQVILTSPRQDPNDPVSYFCAFLALVPQGLCVVYATLIWSSREIEIALMFAGQLACEALNFALKRLIKEERPRQMNGKGYGMPSSHAQFVAYFSVSLALFLTFRHQPVYTGKRRNHTPLTMIERLFWSAMSLVVAAAVAWSRIYLNYHTQKQVLVGSAAGTVSAIAWFLVTTTVRRSGWLAWGIDHPIARFLRVRDLVVEEDLSQAGWEKWDDKQTALKARNKKVS